MKTIFGTAAILIFTFLFVCPDAMAQNTDQNQINKTVPHNNNSANPAQSPNQNSNSGNINRQNNNINNPYTTVPFDSVNPPPPERILEKPDATKHDALQDKRHILQQSGQNQVIIPPDAARDTSIRRIPETGKNNTSRPDTSRSTQSKKRINPTIMGSPADSSK